MAGEPVVRDDVDVVDPRDGEDLLADPLEDRDAADGEQRLRAFPRQRIEAGRVARAEQESLHGGEIMPCQGFAVKLPERLDAHGRQQRAGIAVRRGGLEGVRAEKRRDADPGARRAGPFERGRGVDFHTQVPV